MHLRVVNLHKSPVHCFQFFMELHLYRIKYEQKPPEADTEDTPDERSAEESPPQKTARLEPNSTQVRPCVETHLQCVLSLLFIQNIFPVDEIYRRVFI